MGSALRSTRPYAATAAALFGMLGALSRPGIDIAVLLPVAVVALVYLVIQARTFLGALLLGLVWGYSFFLTIAIGGIGVGQIVVPGLTAIGIGLMAVPLCCWLRFARARFAGWALFGSTAAAWTLVLELQDSLGFPLKGVVASPLVISAPWLVAGARLVGTNVLGGLMMAGFVVTGSSLAGLGLRGPAKTRAVFKAFVPVFAAAGSTLALSVLSHWMAPPAINTVKVGVPQINAEAEYYSARTAVPAAARRFDARFNAQLSRLADVDLIALTESYDGTYSLIFPELRQRWMHFALRRSQAVIVTGYLVEPKGKTANVAAGFDEQGRLIGIHRKVHPAPFGETHLAPGASFEPLRLLSGFSVGVLICQEAFRVEGARELASKAAGLLVTTTDDATFESSLLVFEHLASARLRAIETGRSMVWASNAGPSAVIDRWGRIVDVAPFREPFVLRSQADVYDDVTLYARYWYIWPAIALLTLAVFGVRYSLQGSVAFSDPLRIPSPRLRRTMLGWAMFVLAWAAASGLAVVSPALVEMRRGKDERAWEAVGQLYYKDPVLRVDPFGRFRTSASDTLRGAIGFFLAYYGPELPAADVTIRQAPADTRSALSEVGKYLKRTLDVDATVVQIAPGSVPHAAAIVRRRDGRYGVLSYPGGGAAILFRPERGDRRTLSLDELLKEIEPAALIPLSEL